MVTRARQTLALALVVLKPLELVAQAMVQPFVLIAMEATPKMMTRARQTLALALVVLKPLELAK